MIRWLMGSLAKESNCRCASPLVVTSRSMAVCHPLASPPGVQGIASHWSGINSWEVNTLHNHPGSWSMPSRIFPWWELTATWSLCPEMGPNISVFLACDRPHPEAHGRWHVWFQRHPASLLLETAPARQNQFPIDFQPYFRHSVILV